MVWRWLQTLWQPHQRVGELAALVSSTARRVEIEGRVEALTSLRNPVSGEPCVALEYRAWPPSTTLGMDGATAHAGRAYQVNARQAVDFVLEEGGVRVLVHTDHGEDLAALHRSLLERYGVSLRAECDALVVGQRLLVTGTVEHRRSSVGTPHRELPYSAIVRAERLRVV
ncbi:hypothetical protein [Paraliomyxa miuraensis]|uniref:hypothetical protein n=1 Tax=Paraliomyxa miuraensis TaxID=376150 RepID=UPI0022574C12|nr:hypothetical protein [Paraliomyxa miuraensis]MCX4243840.1 hypothetical protein [Paraliomyxa miuraensis]